MIRWLLPSTWTVTGLVFVSWADLPRTCLTVTTGTTISCGMAPPWTKRAPPTKWNRFAPLGIQNSMSPSAPAVTLNLPCHAAS